MSDLHIIHCVACEGGIPALTEEEITKLLPEIKDWQLSENGQWLIRRFSLKNFYATMALVNAIAWIDNKEGHHPDMEIDYNYCVVKYQTHAVKGLTKNDFICAAKIDLL